MNSMSSAERILLWIVVLIFAGGVIYALIGTRQRGAETDGQFATTTEETAGSDQLPSGWVWYTDTEQGFRIGYPSAYQANTDYTHGTDEQTITGVSFTIPATYATGTNLSSDTYVSVEQGTSSPGGCTAGVFIAENGATTTVTENGVVYSFAEMTDAAAGNRYEELVYALSTSSPCTAVRYVIHSTAIENYDPGSVTEFDRSQIIAEFDEIRRSLQLP